MEAVAKDVERFCIFEDDLPRSGGRWPEYAATMILCFDRWENDMAIGSLWTFFQSTPIPFHGLDNLLFIMDAMMDQAEQPMPWMARRHIKEQTRPHSGRRPQFQNPDLYPSARYHAGSAACGRQSRGMFSQWPGTAVSPSGNYKTSICSWTYGIGTCVIWERLYLPSAMQETVRNCLPNGIVKPIFPLPLKPFPTAARKRSGGSVKKATAGR